MFVSTRSSRTSNRPSRVVLGVAAMTMALSGTLLATGAASAAPTLSHGSVPYTPTITKTPGAGCSAVIGATKLPQTRPMDYRVKVDIKRFGRNCGSFLLAVKWTNTTTGGTGGQYQTVLPDGSVEGFSDNILDGFGFAPGAGRITSTITTYSKSDEEGEIALPNIPGRSIFTLY
ncbi:hypothetical protein [Williamsia phyllosphaerae]|uniref:DUF2690 domain-containing protein n=1 Tax=Williamsia phyllosphaerae TaxID=885042 RepID=A0ABQ1V8E3_9NOCA|nr:hypothetical protein [Williamsia phyllosphaerae]GGF42327.1 hypothetical protein GCM10007298_42530 [Williamsia phyllosphaerae]